MAAYNTITKIFVVDSQDVRADSVAGSAAKLINDYIQALDSTTGTIVNVTANAIGNNTTRVQIIHLG